MKPFDLNLLTEPSIRREYDVLLRRAEAVTKSVQDSLGADRDPIKYHFVEADVFNACVTRDQDAYFIEINNSVPLLMMILFGALLSQPDMLPYLDSKSGFATNENLPAVVDPLNFEGRAIWDVKLTAERSFAALTLADMCSLFIFCHEIGHIVSGHADAQSAVTGDGKIAELISVAPKGKIDETVLQAWELDADGVAASLMISFIDELLTLRNARSELDALLGDREEALPNLLAIAVSSLFAVFCYITGTRDQLDLKSTHPHPLVRAHYLHDMILNAAEAKWTFDRGTFEKCFDERLDETMHALEQIKLLPARILEEDFGSAVQEDMRWQINNQKRVKAEFASWSWVEWG